MTTLDKVAMILSKHGYSLTEGMKIYDAASENGELVHIDKNKNCVVWLDTKFVDPEKPETNRELYVTVWHNYSGDFLLNYNLAGAIAMHDRELDLDEEDTKKFLEFFQSCHDAYREDEELPNLPDSMKWIFKMAVLEDYMNYTLYNVDENTIVNVEVSRS